MAHLNTADFLRAPTGLHPNHAVIHLRRILPLVLSALLAAGLTDLAMAAEPEPTANAARPEVGSLSAGSYEVAPVRILGVPALVVASPQLHGEQSVVNAQQRAEVIEGNLRLLYANQALCSQPEQLSEALLERVVLGGPHQQQICSGDPWAVHGRADQLVVEQVPGQGGTVVLQARLPGRPVPLTLLTVTLADGQLYGLSPEQLAAQWQQVLQRRLRHARRTMQPDQLGFRLRVTLALELLLLITTAGTLKVWNSLRSKLSQLQRDSNPSDELQKRFGLRRQPLRVLWFTRLSFAMVLLQSVAMLGLAVAAIPGRIPLALALLLQPLEILLKAAAVAAVVVLVRMLLRLFLRQWRSNPNVSSDLVARRHQRYRNLVQAGQRLLNLSGLIVVIVLAISGIPGIGSMALSTWLAGGAVLGALALVFQGLLRDFAAGLVILLEDHYAVGDWVQVEALEGTVEDVGILATSLRALDQRVVVIPNSSCSLVVNHTRLRSGVELTVPLPPENPHLNDALHALQEECGLFASNPDWVPRLLAPPLVRGVKRITPIAVELSVLLITHAGDQWAAERALLTQIVERFERDQLPLAQARAVTTG
jgi:small conductance mechanosensitive channel